jgi:lipopolysaccharide export system protein LptA
MLSKKGSAPISGIYQSTKVCIAYIALLCLCMLPVAATYAQTKDTAKKSYVELSADNVYGFKTDSGDVSKFIGHAVFHQGTDTLYCDSLYQFKKTNVIEAFSNVKLAQAGGTQGTSDYLKYTSDKKLAFMQGNVTLTDGKNNLNTAELTYDLGTKIAVYSNGGILHNDSTTVKSNTGVYSVNEKNARFKGNAVITDPQYNIRSEDLLYNTDSKVTQFFARSVVVRDSGRSILTTSKGTYDGQNGIAYFMGHSTIWNHEQYIEGDSLYYNKVTGYGLANGNVISIDTGHHATIYCGHAEYFQKKRILWATVKPVLEQVNGKDTIYIRADTFYSAPMVKPKVEDPKPRPANDTLDSAHRWQGIIDTAQNKLFDDAQLKPKIHKSIYRIPTSKSDTVVVLAAKPEKKKSKKNKKGVVAVAPAIAADTTAADTTAPLYFIGYHHVLIFSDSLQGMCDSVCYTRSDSTIRMMYDPKVWAHNSQITGDTILLLLDSSRLRQMYVPNNAFIISQSGPARANFFDQVQGKTLTAYFKNNAITKMLVFPDAQSIYYPKDDKGAYIGVDQASSVKMLMFFEDQKITDIKFDQDVHVTMTPFEKADISSMRLSKFRWLIDQRPKTKEELFK